MGRDPSNILQRNRKVDPLFPKRASTKQMAELKPKIDKYKNIHFPKEKPFKKPTLKDKPVRKPGAVPPKTETIKMAPLPEIKLDYRMLRPVEKDPQLEAMEQRFNYLVKKDREEKIRNATTGLAGLIGGDPKFKL